MQIVFEFNNKSIVVEANDDVATKSFISILPMKLEFEDYNNTEKISYLDTKLETGDTSGYKPNKRDFAYYSPWGNICLFMKPFSFSSGLVYLGKIIEGFENLSSMDEAKSVNVFIKK